MKPYKSLLILLSTLPIWLYAQLNPDSSSRICYEPSHFSIESTYNGVGNIDLLFEWTDPEFVRWEREHDGSFESNMASNDGGHGIATLFFPREYPCTIMEVSYFNCDMPNYWEEELIYILNTDGTEILAGPYSVIDAEPDKRVVVDIDDLVITEGGFMVSTQNPNAHGPFVGMDEDNYYGNLYFGTVGTMVELGDYNLFFAGSHEALVQYDSISNPELLGYNLYNTYHGLVNTDSLITELFFEQFNIDPLQGNKCYYVEAVYDTCLSGSSDTACYDIPTSLRSYLTEELEVWPNPFNNHINIPTNIIIDKIELVDQIGRNVELKFTQRSHMIDTKMLNYGLYILIIHSGDNVFQKKLIKAN